MNVIEAANELENICLKNKILESPLELLGKEKIDFILDIPIFRYSYSQNTQELMFNVGLFYQHILNNNTKYLPEILEKIKKLLEYECAGME